MTADPMDDAAAYATLFAQHYRRVQAFCTRRVGSADAEELTSEVFLRAWQHWETSRERGLPWLYRTASHVVAEYRRRQHHHDHVVQHLQSLSTITLDHADAEARTEQANAAAALLQLSEADRGILLALSWDGLTTAELAVVLGCSVPTAYVRVHRARRRLAAVTGEGPAHRSVGTSPAVTTARGAAAGATPRPGGRAPLAPNTSKELR